jgi:outer membrane protein TolC
LKGNREVQSAALEVERASEETAALKTTRLPQFQIYALGGQLLRQVSFTVPQGALGTFAATGPIPAQDSTVTQPRQFAGFILGQALQPVSQLHKIRLSLISSQINKDLAEQRLRQKRQDTARSVRELYYQLAETQTQIESTEATVKTLQALQSETEGKLVELAALKSDRLSVRARLSQQRYQLIKLRDASKTQKESVNRLLGRDLKTEFSVEVQPLPAAEEIDLALARSMALRQRPELEEAQASNQEGRNGSAPPARRVHPRHQRGFHVRHISECQLPPAAFLECGPSAAMGAVRLGQKTS